MKVNRRGALQAVQMRLPIVTLTLLATATGCFHDPDLVRGDQQFRNQAWPSAREAYGKVLTSPKSEEDDKDKAAEGWRRAWQAEQDARKVGIRKEIEDLSRIPQPEQRLLAATKIQGVLATLGRMESEQRSVLMEVDRAAAEVWKDVDELARQGKFVAAEEKGTRLLAIPGLSVASARNIHTLRQRAAAHYTERGKKAGPIAQVMYRSLAEHFALVKVGGEATLLDESTPSYELEVAGASSDPACVRAVNALEGRLNQSRGSLRMKMRITFSACNARTQDDKQQKTAEYFVTVPNGTREEVYDDIGQKCETYPFCYPATGVGSDGRYGTYNKCVNETRCTPTVVKRTRVVPDFKEVAQQESYTHTFRTVSATINAKIEAEAPGLAPRVENFARADSEKDEQYDRANKRLETRDRRAFSSKISATNLFATIEPEFTKSVLGVSDKVVQQRGDQLLGTTSATDDVAKTETIVRAALFGSPAALAEVEKLVGLTHGQLRALYLGQDPLPRNVDPEPPLALGGAERDEAPKPMRNKGFPGFDATTRLELVGGLTSVDAPYAGVPGETALMIGAQLAAPLLGAGKPSGFQYHDTFGALVALGGRTSSDVFGSDHDGLSFRVDADYTGLLGTRLGRFGIFGGARARTTLAMTGEISSYFTFQMPLCGKAEYRFRGYSMPAVMVCAASLLGGSYAGVEAQMPWPSGETHLFFRYEGMGAPEATLGKYGSNSAPLSFTTWFVGIGGGR